MKKLIALFMIMMFSASVSVACDLGGNDDQARRVEQTPGQNLPDVPVGGNEDTSDAE